MDDLKIIKDKYGEKMMKLCRLFFPSLLDETGTLSKLMLERFEPSRFLYDDLVWWDKVEDFKEYILNIAQIEKQDIIRTKKTPYELLDEAGYILYQCKTEEDIQYFTITGDTPAKERIDICNEFNLNDKYKIVLINRLE